VGAKSVAFVPLISNDRVIAVISVATTDDYRAFSADDLAVMQTLASEASIALERTRTAIALGEALARERMLTSIGRRLRMELDLDSALTAAVEEVGSALEAARCFVRVGDASGELPVVAEWTREGVASLGDDSTRFPVSNLAAREDRLRDLGGLMLEMYRRDQFRQDLLVDRCVELVQLEERLARARRPAHGGGLARPCTTLGPLANAERPSSGARSSAPSAGGPSAQPRNSRPISNEQQQAPGLLPALRRRVRAAPGVLA